MDDLEVLRQENHRLTLKLESLKSTSTTEIDYLRDELKDKEREFKEVLEKIVGDAKAKEMQLIERTEVLNEDLNNYKDETDKLKAEIEGLKFNLEQQKIRNNEALNRKSILSMNLDHYEALQDTLSEKEIALSRANETISGQSERLREYAEAVDSQRSRITELIEEIESKEITILEQQEKIRHLESDRNERIQLNQLQTLEACDTARTRGNSLFSEVEERRVKVEDELKRLRSRVAKLTTENMELHASIERGDSRHSAVNSQLQLLQKSEEQVIKEFKQMKSERHNCFEDLQERLTGIRNEYLKQLNDYRAGNVPVSEDIEKLYEERDKLLKNKINLEQEIFNVKKELKFTKHNKTECEAHLRILRIKLLEQSDRRSSRSPRKKVESNHTDDKTEDIEERINNDSMDMENNLSTENSKKSEEIAECKQQ